MAGVKVNPVKIEGRWRSGVALDLHTTSSTPIGYNESGYMQFETVRPEIAELVYRLKNRADPAAAAPIIDAAVEFLVAHRNKFDSIVPVPPSYVRKLQPVIIIAEGIGAALGIPVLSCVSTTRPTTQLKNVTDPEQRKKLVDGLYRVDVTQTRGRSIILFDDLYRSGTTINAITDELLGPGEAATVRALTITRTRSNQ